MVKIVLKLLALTTVILGIKIALWAYLHTYEVKYSDEIGYKINSLLKPIREEVNTVFVGSSRTAHGFNPAVFDSVTHHQTRSFNLGINALFAPNTFIECGKLLQMNGLHLKTIFLELSFPPTETYGDPFGRADPFAEIGFKNTHFLQQQRFGPASVQRGTALYDSYLTQFFRMRNAVHLLGLTLVRAGELNYAMTPTGYRYFEPGTFRNRSRNPVRVATLPDTTPLPRSFTKQAQLYRDQLMQLVRQCEAKKVAIYFYLPPRLMAEEKDILPNVYAALPDRYRIAVPYRREYTAPFPADCSDDEQHLNEKSAALYSRSFARAFRQKVPVIDRR
ncbi:hypothetical protein [Larkinella rosea]|uniref:DUF1574 domain-containing protein n=1 Tax=Larkinella rosea TaxID=2025312 RepID=A0A3P1BFJ0_9BACT|nr:hypothetical protein [Larkinella rosea]RRA99820.1 hypothetical protein EHT25_24620 [Larkinella rosea]